ncbi:MAG: hypothetical protein ABJF23_07755 [Bryobacteraceae bacterium]
MRSILMEKSNFALRLLPSLRTAAQRIAERENCSVNQLINIALAEKIAVLDAEYWDARKKAALSRPPSSVLKRLAGDEPPREGDELPQGLTAERPTRKARVLTAD